MCFLTCTENFPCRRLLLYAGFLEHLLPTSRLFIQQAIAYPLTSLIPHCVHHIVSLHEKCDKESAPKITSFYTTMKKYNKNFAPTITSFHTTKKKCNKESALKITSFYAKMKKYDKNFAPTITSFYTTMKKCNKE